MSNMKRHPIQVVTRRTGLSPDLLRTWERRYGAIRPGRTQGGHRLYSDADIERLQALKAARDAGRSISQVADLSPADLDAIVREDRGGLEAAQKAAASSRRREVELLLQNAIAAVERLDSISLETTLSKALVALPPQELVTELVAPFMRRIGQLWFEQRLNPAQEHFASASVRSTLSRVISAIQATSPGAPRIVVGTPSGQRHEIGAMLVAAVAAAQGWHVTYLGPDLPPEPMADAARITDSKLVAVSLVFPENDPAVHEQLRRLRSILPADTQIVAGGRSVENYRATLAEIDALVGTDIRDVERLLTSALPESQE